MNVHIKVVVQKNGMLSVEVQGTQGSQCLSLTESLERDLGEVLERQRTNDFYKSTQTMVRNKITQKNILA